MAPMSAGIRVDRNVQTGVVSYSAEDERIRIDNQQGQGIRRIDVRLKSEGRDIDIKAEIMDDGSLPAHQVVTPTADDDFTFTHKVAGYLCWVMFDWAYRYTLNSKKIEQSLILPLVILLDVQNGTGFHGGFFKVWKERKWTGQSNFRYEKS